MRSELGPTKIAACLLAGGRKHAGVIIMDDEIAACHVVWPARPPGAGNPEKGPAVGRVDTTLPNPYQYYFLSWLSK